MAQPYKNINYTVRIFLVSILLISTISRATANAPVKSSKRSFNDSILVKILSTKIAGKTKLYSDNSIGTLFFSATGDEKKLYQLFLFDMGGKLVSQTQIRNSEKASLSRFERGSYMFEVFNNDDKIEYGSIIVK